MSVASLNLFAVLDEDNSVGAPKAAAPAAASSGPVRDVVKKNTSSKKADSNPRSNNASRPSKRPQYQGNEAAFRDRDAGRDANRSRPVDDKAEPRRSRPARAPRGDRHSNTGKTDSAKAVEKGWGDDKKKLDDETAAESIAKADEKADASEDAAVDAEKAAADAERAAAEAERIAAAEAEAKTKTLEQYYQELSEQAADLGPVETRKPNEGVDDSKYANQAVLKREEEDFVSASKVKAVKSKKTKEKVVLEVTPTFSAPSSSSGERRTGGPRGGDRNGDRNSGERRTGGPRGERRSNNAGPANSRRPAPRQQKKAAAPAVNLSNPDEFPTLGA